MVAPLVKSLCLKVIFPASLLFAAFLRPSILSSVYVLLALICPLLPSIEATLPLQPGIRGFVIISFAYCFLSTLAQSIYQIYEKVTRPEEAEYRKWCNTSSDVDWLRYAGFVRFHGGDSFESSRSILPEITAFVASFLTFLIVSVFPHRDEELDVVGNIQQIRSGNASPVVPTDTARRGFSQFSMVLRRVTNVLIIVLAAVVGSMQPSLLNSIYFLSFLFIATWWSLYKPLRHTKYNTVKRLLLLWSVVHILIIYLYQIPVVQDWIPAKSFVARLVGLSALFTNSCDRWWAYPFNPDNEWPEFVNPVAILVFYQVLVLQLTFTKNGSRTYFDDGTDESSVHEQLLAGDDVEGPSDQAEEEPHQSIPLRKVTSKVVDRHKISQIFMGERAISGHETASEGLVSIVLFALQHAYTLALVSIMVWALIYHSIFGLILLFIGCILWMFKDTRKACFRLSPILMMYIEFLLLVQYMCSMPLDLEFDTWVKMMGVVFAENMEKAFVTLLVKVLLSLPVFLLLRLSLREKFYDALSEHERSQRINQSYGTFATRRRPTTAQRGERQEIGEKKTFALFRWLSRQLVSVWIFVVAAVLLVVATQNNPVIYSIGFFVIWAFLIIYVKISLPFFRGIAYVFWLGTIIYTSVVIISLYVFQFDGFEDVWIRWTGLDSKWDADIGLVNYQSIGKNGSLFFRLLWPICLFLVTTLQLKFFHGSWSKMTHASPDPLPEITEETDETKITLTEKVTRLVNDFLELVWRFTEVHISKIVFIIVAVFIANNICALYFPLVVLISLALCLPSGASGILSLIMCAYLAVVAVFKMIYQLQHIPDFGTVNSGGNCNATQSFSHWLGVEKNANTWSLLNGLVISMIALGIQSVVVYRQRHMRIRRGESEDLKKLVFPSFSMRDYDQSVANGLRFVIDYGFYKFGLEVSFILMGVNAWVRMDLLGAVMCIWIAFFALSKRSICRNLWPIFVLYMAIILPVQYALYVGLPEESCVDYPWSKFFKSEAKNRHFDIWMGLSNYKVDWPPSNLIIDFFLLLAASCQLTIFRFEGEENDSIYPDEVYELKPNNPHYDFISHQRSFIDFLKIVVFHYGHWITLITTLIAGIGGTSLFALGYIVLTFWILWQGNNLYVMNPQTNSFKSTLARWNTLLSYTTFTMFCKVALQLVGCVFLEWFSLDKVLGCALRQVFSITCVNKIVLDQKLNLFDGMSQFDINCPVTPMEAKIGFDTVALGFLVLQLRIFHSWYFQHCMVEYRSEVLLANRGAVLKNQLVEKEMKEQNVQQTEKFDEIRRRTQAIRERYNKQQAKGVAIFEPQTYGQAKRAGDYYMFDYDPSTDELVEPVESFVPETDPQATKFDKLDPTQLVYVAGARDDAIARTLQAIETAERSEDNEQVRMAALVTPVSSTEQPQTDDTQMESEEEAKPAESKAIAALRFVKKVVCNGMDWASVQLNKLSREHRYVAFVLSKEKEKMKDTFSESLSNTTLRLTDLRSQMDMPSLHMVQSESDIAKMESEAQNNFMQRSSLARLVNALGTCIAANTDILCYFLAVLAHAMGGGIITLPLPLMVFLWGTLSNPRPSKSFWVAMIAYTEFVIVMKFVFQFSFFEFNKPDKQNENTVNPLSTDKWLGLQRQNNFAAYDVPLLFGLFFHRYMLRKLGLWKDANLTVTFADDTQVEDGMNGSVTMETIAHSRANSTHTDGEAPTEAMEEGLQVATVKENEEGKQNPIARFIRQLFMPKFRYIRDLYPSMFGLDVLCFLIVAFGYSGFGEGGSGNVIGDIQKNRIPLTLVVMLIVMTLMIVIDRGLYLRKWVYGKLAYQLVIIVFIHAWIFFVLPTITRKSALENHVAQALYIVKCFYLMVSAWQIRNGYPQLCIGNLLTHAYGLANMVFFKIFMAVPFLFELRTAIDWTWTDTSMPLFDFFNMENFYATIYNLKCARTFEGNYPAPRGQPKGVIVKYFMGLPMILAIILLVWLPLLMFALLNQIGDISIPDRVTFSVAIEGYPPIYQIEAQGGELTFCTPKQHDDLSKTFSSRFFPDNQESIKRSRNTVSFLNDYSDTDILMVDFRPEAEVFWPISKEALEALIYQLRANNSTMHYQLLMEFSRPYDAQKKVAAKHTYLQKIEISNTTEERNNIIAALGGNGTITIPNSFPSYTLVPNEGEVTVPDALVASIVYNQNKDSAETNTTKNSWFDTLTLSMETLGMGGKVWVAQAQHPTGYDPKIFFNGSDVPYGTSRKYIQTTTFIDRAYPSLFAKYLQGGVITMYVSLVIVVGRLLRGVFTSSPSDIMVSEIPNPDYMLKICLDIYLVREAKDFFLEQDLFAKLIFLFRSPATLIQWTRYKVKND